MNFCAYASIIAMLLAGCLQPGEPPSIEPRVINERVFAMDGWDMGCDNLGNCVAIGALPPRKAKMNGIRGALRITFGNVEGQAPELTIIPLDFEQRLPDVKPSPKQSAALLAELRDARVFMLIHKDTDGTNYYLPGRDFRPLENLHRQWLKAYPVRLVQQEPIMPVKGLALSNFRAPILSDEQLVRCTAADKGRIEAAWDVGTQFRLFRYACSAKVRTHAQTLWFTQDKQSGQFDPVGIAEAVGPATNGKAAGLFDAYFEPSQGLLVTKKSGASEDCGLLAVYAATPSGFVLAERRQALNCVGLFGGDWVRTYRDPGVIMPDHW
jgi:hypothetical protein